MLTVDTFVMATTSTPDHYWVKEVSDYDEADDTVSTTKAAGSSMKRELQLSHNCESMSNEVTETKEQNSTLYFATKVSQDPELVRHSNACSQDGNGMRFETYFQNFCKVLCYKP